MDQQQQITTLQQRSVGELLILAGGLAIIGLGAIWGARQVIPEWKPPT